MKTFAPFQTIRRGDGELILTPFNSLESRIISNQSIVSESIARLPENAEGEQLRSQLYQQYIEQNKETSSLAEFFVFENLEFDTQKYSHRAGVSTGQGIVSTILSYAHSLGDSVSQLVSPLQGRFIAS
jgi:hypothetical protein